MSDDTTTRARPYPAALKDEIADLNIKMDSLIKHWADAAEMTTIVTYTAASQGDGFRGLIPVPATLVCCPGGKRGLVFAHATPKCVGGFTPIASATAYPPRTHAFTGVTSLVPPGRQPVGCRESIARYDEQKQ